MRNSLKGWRSCFLRLWEVGGHGGREVWAVQLSSHCLLLQHQGGRRTGLMLPLMWT